ncbi:MAG: GDP-mannose 4,6-dehydratase, partial [Chitinophagales bacterium]
MNILITGACGMVGSHMVDYYHAAGGNAIIATYYKPTTDLNDIRSKCKLIECDVRYFQRVHEIIAEYKPFKIFHLAAQSYPTVSWERPQETMDVNVNGTVHVFESVKAVRKVNPD